MNHNLSAQHSATPTSLIKTSWQNRYLLKQLVLREIIGRYRGSILGIFWSFLTPVLMLLVYTFVFSVVFKMKWGIGGQESTGQFAMMLFVGIILHSMLAEVFTRAPHLITGNVNYVKRIVFPLEFFPIVIMGAALVHALISFIVLVIAMLIFGIQIQLSTLLLPIVILPFVLLLSGIAWSLAAFGVYLRDIGQFIGMLVMVFLFLAPIFYPLSLIPEHLQPWMYLNPLTLVIEQTRGIILLGEMPNWHHWGIYLGIAIPVAWIGFVIFQNARRGFSDVL